MDIEPRHRRREVLLQRMSAERGDKDAERCSHHRRPRSDDQRGGEHHPPQRRGRTTGTRHHREGPPTSPRDDRERGPGEQRQVKQHQDARHRDQPHEPRVSAIDRCQVRDPVG